MASSGAPGVLSWGPVRFAISGVIWPGVLGADPPGTAGARLRGQRPDSGSPLPNWVTAAKP